MLTSLEPPSPTSSGGPREVERSLQTTPQLPGALPMTSPPESENHRDAAESSRVTPVFKRWLQTRFKKTNENQASQPTANITKKAPSRMAAARRVRVSIFLSRQKVCDMSDEVSQRTVAKPVNWVRCSVCSLALLLILRRSVKDIPRLQTPTESAKMLLIADKSPQVQRKWTLCVSF